LYRNIQTKRANEVKKIAEIIPIHKGESTQIHDQFILLVNFKIKKKIKTINTTVNHFFNGNLLFLFSFIGTSVLIIFSILLPFLLFHLILNKK